MTLHSCSTCQYFIPINSPEAPDIKNKCSLLDIWNMEGVEEENDCPYHELIVMGGDGGTIGGYGDG